MLRASGLRSAEMKRDLKTFAFLVGSSLVSTLMAVAVVELLSRRREAEARAPLPGPVAPGQGTA